MPSKYTNKLHDTNVLILGGTSGIGFAVAENALENGAHVVVASSQQSSIDKTISRLQSSYPDLSSNIRGQTIDLRSDDAEISILELLKYATNDGKDLLDHVVSTAGDSLPIQNVSEFAGVNALADAMRVRVAGPLFIAKHAPGKYLKISSRSSITLTGGVNTYRPAEKWWSIAMFGGALDGLVRGLAVDLKPIRVNVVAPGAIQTEIFAKNVGDDKEKLEAVYQSFGDRTLLGRMGSPEDMSETYLYAMRDGYLTGQSILSDGGLILK